MAFILSVPIKLILQGTQGRWPKVIHAVSRGPAMHRQPILASHHWSHQRMWLEGEQHL